MAGHTIVIVERACAYCNGTGYEVDINCWEQMHRAKTYPIGNDCSKPCRVCKGSGWVPDTSMRIRIIQEDDSVDHT